MTKHSTPMNPVDLKQARLLAQFGEISRQWQHGDDMFSRLARRLQTTLELEQILDMFVEELSQVLSFDSLSYSRNSSTEHFTFSKGQGGKHHCDYSLNLQGEHLGQLQLNRRHRFVDEELIVLEKLIGQLVFPLRNAWLYREAVSAALTDTLTGLGNKRALQTELQRELELAKRHGERFSVIVCDLDHFKSLNDTHGHVFGDDVLAETARKLQDSVRRSDRCFRYGGEEFIILLPRTPIEEALAVAERTRNAIATTRFYCEQQRVNVTLSAGVATYAGEQDINSLIRKGDGALYAAKRLGRNQVQVAGDLPPASAREEQSTLESPISTPLAAQSLRA